MGVDGWSEWNAMKEAFATTVSESASARARVHGHAGMDAILPRTRRRHAQQKNANLPKSILPAAAAAWDDLFDDGSSTSRCRGGGNGFGSSSSM